MECDVPDCRIRPCPLPGLGPRYRPLKVTYLGLLQLAIFLPCSTVGKRPDSVLTHHTEEPGAVRTSCLLTPLPSLCRPELVAEGPQWGSDGMNLVRHSGLNSDLEEEEAHCYGV